MWNIHEDEGENSCWIRLDTSTGEAFTTAKKLLNYTDTDIDNIKILIVASQVESK